MVNTNLPSIPSEDYISVPYPGSGVWVRLAPVFPQVGGEEVRTDIDEPSLEGISHEVQED